MGFHINKIYGDTNTWISFLGTYIGSIISGVITFIGVMLTIQFTRNENRRDKLPEKITNLEVCIDFVEECLDEIGVLKNVDIEELFYKGSHDRKLLLFDIDDNYILIRKENHKNLTRDYLKKIRNLTVLADTEAYWFYTNCKNEIHEAFINHIDSIESRLQAFQVSLIDNYLEDYDEIIISNNGRLTEIPLSSEDMILLNSIKSQLYRGEQKYIFELELAYGELLTGLNGVLYELTYELSRKNIAPKLK